MRIAILEDDEIQATLIEGVAASAGHDCHLFANGAKLIRECGRESFDLFVLDWEVPESSGVEVLKWIRSSVPAMVPVIFVTSRESEQDIISVLAAGADDYMTKPIRPTEFVARLTALLRRSYPSRGGALSEFGEYAFDTRSMRLHISGKEVLLTQKEFDLALFFFRNIGRLLSRGHLIEAVWGRPNVAETRTLDTHLSKIRSKLALRPENGFKLIPVYSYGYRFERVSKD
ncbi:MAG: response regulator transcription factor [Burkholderiales bacterium]